MPGTKRFHVADVCTTTSGAVDVPKTEPDYIAGANPALQEMMEGSIKITITIGSTRKAKRNDPKPPVDSEEEFCRMLEAVVRQSQSTTESSSPTTGAGASGPQRDDGVRTTLRTASGIHSNASNTKDVVNENQTNTSGDGDIDMCDDQSDTDGDTASEDSYENDVDDDAFSDLEELGDPFPWLEIIRAKAIQESTGTASAASGKPSIGSCGTKLIRRGQIRQAFWQNVEEPTRETADLAFTLFDRYGRFNPEYYEHDFRKGTGVWGKELDIGDILVTERIEVIQQWRRRGIATNLVNGILAKMEGKVAKDRGFFAMVNPGVLLMEQKQTEDYTTFFAREMPISLRFWRSIGFRRVGTTSWFAYTNTPDHPSKLLEPTQDCDKSEQTGNYKLADDVKALFDELLKPSKTDKECVDLLLMTLPDNPKDQVWLVSDKEGDTLLHVAALMCKPQLLKVLLSKVPQLQRLRNKEGYTPLETLQHQLEIKRTRLSHGDMLIVMSDQFRGFDDASVACLAALHNVEAVDLSDPSLPWDYVGAASSSMDDQIGNLPRPYIAKIRQTLRLKFGCTCGQCIGGFLSPLESAHGLFPPLRSRIDA